MTTNSIISIRSAVLEFPRLVSKRKRIGYSTKAFVFVVANYPNWFDPRKGYMIPCGEVEL